MTESPVVTEGRLQIWRVLQAIVALFVFGLLVFGVQELLNPFVLFLILLIVLIPFRRAPGYVLLVSVAAILTMYWLLATTGFLLAPFVLGFGLAYVLDPLVDALVERRVARSLAIVLLALPVVGAGVAAVLFGIPALVGQIDELVQAAPELVALVGDWLSGIREFVVGIPGVGEDVVPDLANLDPEEIVAFLQERREQLASGTWRGVLGLGRGLGSAATVAGYVFLTPILTFYLLRDYDGILARLRGLLPRSREAGVVEFAREYDVLLSRYLRGQLTVALIIGVLTGTLLLVVQFPYASLLGALAGVMGLIPFLGLVLSIIPAVIIALVSGSVLWSLAKVAFVYGLVQILDSGIISPRVVGDSVGLHPVWIVLALSVGGFFFGFVGLLISVPAAVGVKLVMVRGLERYRSSELYESPQG
ncbi:MAG: AI-2E family transporter [Gemmatimonadota bacterium]|nr:AI-2E family transporter [Gemmatimonadota bacterium]